MKSRKIRKRVLYVLFILILALVTVVLFFYFAIKKVRPLWKKIGGMILSFGFTILFLFMFLFPPFQEINIDDRQIESEVIYIKHETKYPDFETEQGERELPIRVWKPNQSNNVEHPVFIFSHGSFGIDQSNTFLFERLAEEGFLVMSLSHPYHSFTTTMSDGRTITVDMGFFQEVMNQNRGLNHKERLENFSKWVGIHIEDMDFLIDEILTGNLDEKINIPMDKNSIFLSGHSLGGAAALDIGRHQPERVNSIIALEAPFFGDILDATDSELTFIQEDYPVPVLNFYFDSIWHQHPDHRGTEYDTNAKLLSSDSEQFVNVHIPGTGHLGLTDLRNLSPVNKQLLDGNKNTKPYEEVLESIESNTIEFVNKQLNN